MALCGLSYPTFRSRTAAGERPRWDKISHHDGEDNQKTRGPRAASSGVATRETGTVCGFSATTMFRPSTKSPRGTGGSARSLLWQAARRPRARPKGNRRARRIDGSAFATVLTHEQFAGTGADLGEILERTVGVQVRNFGGLGDLSTISIRGSTAEQVEIFLDGIPLNRALGGGVDLSTLPLGNVERVEVYRGTAPAGLALSNGPRSG